LSREEAKDKSRVWRPYDKDRRHSAQGWMTSAGFGYQRRNKAFLEAFRETLEEPENSSQDWYENRCKLRNA